MVDAQGNKIPLYKDLRILSKAGAVLILVMFFLPWFSHAGFPYSPHSRYLSDFWGANFSGFQLIWISSRIVQGAFVVFLPLVPLLWLTIITLIEEEFNVLRRFSIIGLIVSIAFAGYVAFRSDMLFGEWIGHVQIPYFAIIALYVFMIVVTHRGTVRDDIY